MAGKSRERGQLIKKGRGKYLIRIYLGRVNGRRKYVSKTVEGSKKEADAELVKWLRDLDTDTFVKPQENKILGEVLGEWLDSKSKVTPKTWETYKGLIAKRIVPELGHFTLSQLSEARLQVFFNDLAEDYAPKTVHQYRSILSQVFKMAIRRRYAVRNPLDGVELPTNKRTRDIETLSKAQVDTLLEDTKDSRWGALWALLLGTGMRPQEACALQWSDLNDGSATIRRVLRDWHSHEKRTISNVGKTAGALGTLKLPVSVQRALEVHRTRQLRDAIESGKGFGYNPEGWVFLSRNGELPVISTIQHAWKRALSSAGLPNHRLYDTRHTHATLLLEAGVHPKVVQTRLRHSSIQQTMDTYSHVRPEMDATAADVYDQTTPKEAANG